MRRPDRSKQKRIAACIMGIVVLVFVLFSAFFIAHEADHDCAGEGCPVCACVAECENTLHQIGGGLVSQIAILFPVVFLLLLVSFSAFSIAQETLISKKVRMNN